MKENTQEILPGELKKESNKNWVDYLAIISLVISIVSLIVSGVIANKQNKINLFEKRFEAYETLAVLYEGAANIEETLAFTEADDILNQLFEDQMSLYVAAIGTLLPEADVQNLDYFDSSLTVEEVEQMRNYIFKEVNKKCVVLAKTELLFKLKPEQVKQIEIIQLKLKEFAAFGYNMDQDHIKSMLDEILKIDFLDEMKKKIDLT